jgi:hypothetical protein
MGRGSIRRRGKRSWQIRFDDGVDAAGRRKARWATVRGTRQDARRELTRMLAATDTGTLPEPSKSTVAVYVREWLDNDHDLAPKTKERYRELAEGQIIPRLGNMMLQRLRPKQIDDWHKTLLKTGARSGGPLSARTVGHAHRVLHRALQKAVETEVLSRNVASAISPPTVKEAEIEILALPANAVAALREHCRKLKETRLALGLGRPDDDTLLFAEVDGSPTAPNRLTRRWQDACVSLGLPRVSFHALRHTHASALIASGLDVVLISRRLGHANPTVTLNVYGHLFKRDDRAAADAIEAAMTRTRSEPKAP